MKYLCVTITIQYDFDVIGTASQIDVTNDYPLFSMQQRLLYIKPLKIYDIIMYLYSLSTYLTKHVLTNVRFIILTFVLNDGFKRQFQSADNNQN